MAKKAGAAIPDAPLWVAEVLRLTVFHRAGSQKDDGGAWAAIVGEQPELMNVKPREGGFEASGPCGGAMLTFKADPLRMDWLLTAPISLDKPPATMPAIGPMADALNTFEPLMTKWLPSAPATHRIAFGATFLQPVIDRVTGYKLLDAYLPTVDVNPEHSSEFLYRINRHLKADAFNNLHVNRIATWTCAAYQPLMLQVQFGRDAQGSVAPVGEMQSAVRVELDINTDAARKEELPKDDLPALFQHLVKLGKEIAEKGDIA